MNPFALAILLGLALEHAVRLAADVLDLRALRRPVPPELADVYPEETRERTREYVAARRRLALAERTAGLAAVLVLWWAGGFAALDTWARGLGLGPVPTGLVYVGVLVLASSLLSLPFAWVATFRIEERFGFNRTTPRTFWSDQLKGLALTALLGGVLLAAVLALFEQAGTLAWVACWAVASAFVVVLQVVVPIWILPLFHRFEPLEEGELRRRVLDYAKRVGFPLEGVFVVDGSRRSTKANAFFTGLGRNRRLALFDTLLEKHSEDEVLAVVAHEVGHFRCRHVPMRTAVTVLHLGVLFGLLGWALRQEGLYAAFGVDGRPVHAGLVFFSLLWAPIDLLLHLPLLHLSRRHEYEADRFAVETTGLREDLATALERLSADSLANPTPHPLHVALHHSHPPVLWRVRAVRGAAA